MEDKDDQATRPWTSARWRLPVLLALLGLSILAAISARAELFNPGGATEATSGPFVKGCPGYGAPEVTTTSTAHLTKLDRSLSRLIGTKYGKPYEQGISTSDRAWSDSSPTPLSSMGKSTTHLPAGYEIRWWVQRRNDIAADVFEFATPEQAKDFLARATSAHCRPNGVARRAPFPLHAYNLLWVNPDKATEQDVYFASGPRVYRVVDVRAIRPRPIRSHRFEQEIGTVVVDLLACKLPGADCQIPAYRPSVA